MLGVVAVAVGAEADVLRPSAQQERERQQERQRYDSQCEPRVAPVNERDEAVDRDGEEERAHRAAHGGDAHGAAAAADEPLGQDSLRDDAARADGAHRAEYAEEEVELPDVVDPPDGHQGQAEDDGAKEHEPAGAVSGVEPGADHGGQEARGRRPDCEGEEEGGPRPPQLLLHRDDEDADAPDAHTGLKGAAHKGDADHVPAVEDPGRCVHGSSPPCRCPAGEREPARSLLCYREALDDGAVGNPSEL